MIIKNLEINDWVAYFSDEYCAYPIQVKRVNADFSIETSDGAKLGVGEIKPVELTEEILFKNGFIKSDEVEVFYYIKSEDGNMFIGINLEEEHPRIEMGGYGSLVTIWSVYIHDLQHGIRFCKIDKEIVV